MTKEAPVTSPDIVLRLSGEGGEGVISLGEILTNIFSSMSWEIMNFKTFPPSIRGGLATYDLRISDTAVLTTGDAPDILLAMNREAFLRHGRSVSPSGLIIADEGAVDIQAEEGLATLGADIIFLPFTRIAREELSFARGKNMVCLGALSRLMGGDERDMIHYLKEKFGKKGASVVEKNINCFRMGFKAMSKASFDHGKFRIRKRSKKKQRCLLNGNEAIALGAMAAGLKFFAGYPITPATSIMEYLADKLPCIGGFVLQMEDEIAAVAAVLGASFGGRLSMTATSGPGLSLMSELIGLAAIAELPAVIVDVQRGGPSTGMPTKTEQSDLNLAMLGIHGEGPKAVLAAADVEDCFHQTLEAFRISEKYQIPVILLSDQHLAYTTSPISYDILKHSPVPTRLKPSGSADDFERFAITKDGISPIPDAGDPGFRYVLSGLEHDPSGRPTHDPQAREAMMGKRATKLDVLAGEEGGAMVFDSGGDTGVISWGSTYGVTREAIEIAGQDGSTIDHLHLTRLHPLPIKTIEKFSGSKKKIIVIEMNQSGQLASVLEKNLYRPLGRITSTRGIPFKPRELLTLILKEHSR